MKQFNIIAGLMLICGIMLSGCHNGIDYVVHGSGDGDTVYVDVPGETEYIEIPIYILVEVPGET